MSSNGEGSKYVSPNKPRHQVTRSVSEASPPPLKPRSHHHHHHHHHIHRRDKDEKSSQYTLQKALTPSGDLRSDGISPNGSRNGSRRPSILDSTVDDFDLFKTDERRPLREGELEAEKEKGAMMATFVYLAIYCSLILMY